MEIAIPMVLLGGMYVLSNQENSQDKEVSSQSVSKEGFVPNRMAEKVEVKALPNTNIPPRNFPVDKNVELPDNPNYYPNSNAATDKYFFQGEYQKAAENDTNSYTSLTGNQVTLGELTHNNMVPFFGSSVKQNTRNLNDNESRLDSMNGSGSQQITKREMAPLFKPQASMQWANGTPNTSDFIQSRMNPSMSMNNTKPWQEIHVGPGLNHPGGTLGSGGFNAGMEARDRWEAKTVDELRTKNNPKVTYGGVLLGAKTAIVNRGIMGKMEKNLPDTYYINSPERYFTTTGIEKAQTARGVEVLKPENRETTTREYFGTAIDGEGSYVEGQHNLPMRPQLDADITHITNAHAPDKYKSTDGDHGIKSYKDSVLPNNRSLTSGPQEFGIASSLKAMVAPIMDFLRPSRKENVIGNLRPTGNVGNQAIQAGTVYNPACRARTTIREMTEDSTDHMFINSQQRAGGYGYTVNKQQQVYQQRDTTSCPHVGDAGNTAGTSNAPTYNAAYNAHLGNRVLVERAPNAPNNADLFNGDTNIQINKLDCDRANNRMWVPQATTNAPAGKEQLGYENQRHPPGQGINCQRTNPGILDAYNKNPYTHSLQSWA